MSHIPNSVMPHAGPDADIGEKENSPSVFGGAGRLPEDQHRRRSGGDSRRNCGRGHPFHPRPQQDGRQERLKPAAQGFQRLRAKPLQEKQPGRQKVKRNSKAQKMESGAGR